MKMREPTKDMTPVTSQVSFCLPRHYSTKIIFVVICVLLLSFLIVTHFKSSHDESDIYNTNALPRSARTNPNGLVASTVRYRSRSRATGVHPSQSCALPKLNVSDEFMMKAVKIPKRRSCDNGHPGWVQLINGSIVFSKSVFRSVGGFSCDFTPALTIQDGGTVEWGETLKNIPDGFRFPADIFRLDCRSWRRHDGHTERQYSNVFHGIAEKEWMKFAPDLVPRDDRHAATIDRPSVLVLGFASMSRLSWLRRMRKTRQYFLNSLRGIEMNGYNAIGGGTESSFFAMLAGLSKPVKRSRQKTLDALPWLWKDFAKAGYITSLAVSDDVTSLWGGNEWSLRFRQQPTHYDLRPFYFGLQSLSQSTDSTNEFCIGEVTKHADWLNWLRDLFNTHHGKPKFMFHFYSSLSLHDNNGLMLADDDIQSFLGGLLQSGHLDHTVLLLLSDHGSSSSDVTSAWHGRLEERLPYMAISFPVWFHQQHPGIVQRFKDNTNRLTTPLDVYQTLKSLTHVSKGHTHYHTNPNRNSNSNSTSSKGINLFEEVPKSRTCSQAHIEDDWCACLEKTTIPSNHTKTLIAVSEVVALLNQLTFHHRRVCKFILSAQIQSADRWTSNFRVLGLKTPTKNNRHTRKSSSLWEDNALPMQDNYYHVNFMTRPGFGQFEATVAHRVSEDSMHVQQGDVMRVDDEFDVNSPCLRLVEEKLRQFCVC